MKYLPIIPILGLLPLVVQADPVDTIRLMRSDTLDQVVVTATRVPRPLKSVPTPIQVITPKEIEQIQPRSVFDMLEGIIPGIQRNQHGGQNRLIIQGFSADYYLFLVDGERIGTEGNGAIDLERIDPSSVERIEVVRGAASALYGSDAIGGVINIITRKATMPVEASARALYDNSGVQRYNGFVGLKGYGFTSSTGGGYGQQDEFTMRLKKGGLYTVNDNSSWNASQRLKWQNKSNSFSAEVYGQFNSHQQNIDRKEAAIYDGFTGFGQLKGKLSDSYQLEGTYNLEGYDRQTWYKRAKSDPYVPIFMLRTHTARTQLNTTYSEDSPVQFNAGVEWMGESLRGDRFADINTRHWAYTTALYAQVDTKFAPNWTLTFGARGDIHSRYGLNVSPKLTFLWRSGYWAFRASYATGFRSPSLKELFMYWYHQGGGMAMFYIKGNPNLKPEQSRMVTLSPEFDMRNLNVSLVAQYTNLRNRILTDYDPSSKSSTYINIDGESQVASATLAVRYIFNQWVRLYGNYAYIWEDATTRRRDGSRIKVSNVRPHTATGTVSLGYGRWGFRLGTDISLRYFSSVRIGGIDTRNGVEDYYPFYYAGYFMLRASVSAEWKHYVTLTVGSENLLDYRPPYINVNTVASGFTSGRSWYAALALRFY